MAESEITTDVEVCYMTTCENNNALTCGLVRIGIGVDSGCLNYKPIDDPEALVKTAELLDTEEEPHH